MNVYHPGTALQPQPGPLGHRGGWRLNRLSHIDRVTNEPPAPLRPPTPRFTVPYRCHQVRQHFDGGGWNYVGKQQGDRNKESTAKRTGIRGHECRPLIGNTFVHTVIDDHSRVAYAEICADEKADTDNRVLQRTVYCFADHGITTRAGALRQRLRLSVLHLAQRL